MTERKQKTYPDGRPYGKADYFLDTSMVGMVSLMFLALALGCVAYVVMIGYLLISAVLTQTVVTILLWAAGLVAALAVAMVVLWPIGWLAKKIFGDE